MRVKDGRRLVIRDVMYDDRTWVQIAQIIQRNLADIGVGMLSSIPQVYGYYPDDLQGNFGRIGSPELNELIERTLSELDPQRAIELANQVDRAVFEEGHSLPLFQWDGSYGVRADLANFGSPGLASYDYTAIGFVQ
ncbi:peptide ABC transporter substrate-binding protein [Mycobacteroides abscessus subsp. abscessus]|nr:peptide ABC transporter substrate-binding protein [Mycobacteroides abscessus subsp. abscessus]